MAEKRVTNNFQRVKTFESGQDKDFLNWKQEVKDQSVPFIYDRRNGIYCMNPTMDFEMYYNYCMYLNESYSEWNNYGYFDMGLVPYLMWPSFMDQSTVLEQMRDVARMAQVNLVKVPAVSFLSKSSAAIGVDYWIFRDDMFKLCNALSQVSPVYKFDVTSPKDVSLSAFLKPLAEMSKANR